MFMNEELGRLKEQCDQFSESEWADKIQLVKKQLEVFKNKPLTEEVVKDVFHIQQFYYRRSNKCIMPPQDIISDILKEDIVTLITIKILMLKLNLNKRC